MTTTQVEKIYIKGISVRTTNENGASSTDIPALWNRFMQENIMSQLAGKMGNDIYCVYTGYEKDFTRPYTTIIGCRVDTKDAQQDGFTSIAIEAGNYAVFIAQGNLQQGVVFNQWLQIWNTALERKYTTDFEIYTEKAADFSRAEVDIFVAIN